MNPEIQLMKQIRKLERDIASQSRLEPETESARITLLEWIKEQRVKLAMLNKSTACSLVGSDLFIDEPNPIL